MSHMDARRMLFITILLLMGQGTHYQLRAKAVSDHVVGLSGARLQLHGTDTKHKWEINMGGGGLRECVCEVARCSHTPSWRAAKSSAMPFRGMCPRGLVPSEPFPKTVWLQVSTGWCWVMGVPGSNKCEQAAAVLLASLMLPVMSI